MTFSTCTLIRPSTNSPESNLYPTTTHEEITQIQLYPALLAHEIRNPLTNIKLAVEVLECLVTDDVQKKYLDIIMRGSITINSLLNELIQQHSLKRTEFNEYPVQELLDEVLLIANDRLQIKNISTTKRYGPDGYVSLVDQSGMKLALSNIVINAIEAMKKGGKLLVMTRITKRRLIIRIEDNGCRIPANNLKQIFKPYFTSKKGGMGIGLAGVLDIFKVNKVRVKVESEEGSGTRFTMLFAQERFPGSKDYRAIRSRS